MALKYSKEELNQKLQSLLDASSNNKMEELSLDELESVGGGFTTTVNEDQMTFTFNEEELQLLHEAFNDPQYKDIIDSFLAQMGLTGLGASQTVTVPLSAGKLAKVLLSLYL